MSSHTLDLSNGLPPATPLTQFAIAIGSLSIPALIIAFIIANGCGDEFVTAAASALPLLYAIGAYSFVATASNLVPSTTYSTRLCHLNASRHLLRNHPHCHPCLPLAMACKVSHSSHHLWIRCWYLWMGHHLSLLHLQLPTTWIIPIQSRISPLSTLV